MSGSPPQGLPHNLVLADGSRWVIAAGDEEAAAIVSPLVDAMQLRATGPASGIPPAVCATDQAGAAAPPRHRRVRRLLVLVDAHDPAAPLAACRVPSPRADDDAVVCVLRALPPCEGLSIQLAALSLVFARDAQARGGVLLHGALAERDGSGVLLAAPGGTGKTTASDRLPAPWRSLCDDTTLVVRDSHGGYWAHPWPTWSRFLREGAGGTWDVQNPVPLRGVFFLSRAAEDRVESVGPGQGVGLLVECAGQASPLMARGLDRAETRAMHLERFDNLCALARLVPTHVLHISLTGAFWRELDRTVSGNHPRR